MAALGVAVAVFAHHIVMTLAVLCFSTAVAELLAVKTRALAPDSSVVICAPVLPGFRP